MDDSRGFSLEERGYRLSVWNRFRDDVHISYVLLTSGVRSLTPNPVPPVVTIKSATSSPDHFLTICWILSSSSGTIAETVHS